MNKLNYNNIIFNYLLTNLKVKFMKEKIQKMTDQELINFIDEKLLNTGKLLVVETSMESDYGRMLTNISGSIWMSLKNAIIIAKGTGYNNDDGIEIAFQLYMMKDETVIYIKAVEDFDTCITTFIITVEGDESYYHTIQKIVTPLLECAFE